MKPEEVREGMLVTVVEPFSIHCIETLLRGTLEKNEFRVTSYRMGEVMCKIGFPQIGVGFYYVDIRNIAPIAVIPKEEFYEEFPADRQITDYEII